ncbi:hypothetical protein [Mycolicibacterium sp. CBMA 226]|uniref:hypothetical protein n=1 Tax=Mycolicibacterium sp. CBMA 226 TaxID=2606611 RepID=UPI0028BE8CE6|nr:hypothetical protein [Mycolicibacterium sp. CBMA 226]
MARASRLTAALLLTAVLAACTPAPKSAQSSSPPTTSAGAESSGEPIVTPVLADVVAAPVPVPATDGRVHLAYELLLTNTSPEPVSVDSIAVMGRPGRCCNCPAPASPTGPGPWAPDSAQTTWAPANVRSCGSTSSWTREALRPSSFHTE